ncbi:MAG: EamA family transporter [Lachnospiraceae bacterium]
MNTKVASGSIILAGILWGTMGLFVRGLSADHFTSMEIVALRVLGALLLVTVIILFYNRKLFEIRMRDCWCFAGTGIFSLTFFNLCYFQTIIMTSMSVAAILLYTAPIIVVLLSAVLFKEKLNRKKIGAMLLAFLGCVCVTGIIGGEGLTISPTGILIGLGSGLGYALYSIFGRYAIERGYESLTISFYTFLFASVGTIFLIPVRETASKLIHGDAGRNLLLVFGIALIATVLPYILYTIGLSHVENGKASIMASIEPVVATLLGIFVFGENLTAAGTVGMILVLAAIMMLNRCSSSLG